MKRWAAAMSTRWIDMSCIDVSGDRDEGRGGPPPDRMVPCDDDAERDADRPPARGDAMTHWLDVLRETVASSAPDGGRALVLGDPAGRAAAVCGRAGLTVVRVAPPHGDAARRFDRGDRDDRDDRDVRAEPTALPFADAMFDVVVAHATLEFSHDDRAVVSELARVLRAGGRLVIRVPRAGGLAGLDALNLFRYLREVAGRGQIPAETLPVGWRRHYHRADLDAILVPSGLGIERLSSGGLALGEVAHLPALVVSRALLPRPHLVRRLRDVYERVGDLDERLAGPATWVVVLRRIGTTGSR